MDKINFEAGTIVTPAKVTINNVDYEVTPVVMQGNTPLSPTLLNQMQLNIENAIYDVSSFKLIIVDVLPTEDIQEKTIYLVPKDSAAENNTYNEYIYINDTWEQIGSTDINTDDLTLNLVENSYEVTLTEAVTGGGTITLPSMYKVGFDRLDVYLNGEKLIKAETSDTEGHYYEVGTEGTLSNVIQITSDWTAEVGDVFEFTIRTNGEGEAEILDPLPVGSILEYDGDVVPDGYEEVAEGENYSTEEVRVGTWIDGKPLYRKVISGAMPAITSDGTMAKTTISIPDNLDYVFCEFAYVKGYASDKNYILPIPYIRHDEKNHYMTYNIYDNTIEISANRASWAAFTAYFSLLYTKITDTGEV